MGNCVSDYINSNTEQYDTFRRKNKNCPHVSFIGSQNVGKTQLIKSYDEFSQKYHKNYENLKISTLDDSFYLLFEGINHESISVQYFDTDIEKIRLQQIKVFDFNDRKNDEQSFIHFDLNILKRSNAIVLVYQVGDKLSLQFVKEKIELLKVENQHANFYIVANKVDLIDKEQEESIYYKDLIQQGIQIAKDNECEFHECSNSNFDHTNKLFQSIAYKARKSIQDVSRQLIFSTLTNFNKQSVSNSLRSSMESG